MKKKIQPILDYPNKTILITGAAGSIGSELSRQIYKLKSKQLLLLDQDETGIFNIFRELPKTMPVIANIREQKRIEEIFKKYKPQIVFHCAAYKHVPLMERYPKEAIRTNLVALVNLAFVSMTNGVEKFIFVSTDKAVKPISVMGRTKRIGEILCQGFDEYSKTKFISVRFGNVLASRGSVIPIWKRQIKIRDTITITHPDMKRYFMTIFEACELVIKAMEMGQGGEIFIFDMGQPIRIIDLARQFIRLSGKNIGIKFIGVRAGEKLFEHLYNKDEEKLIPTKHKKILQVVET